MAESDAEREAREKREAEAAKVKAQQSQQQRTGQTQPRTAVPSTTGRNVRTGATQTAVNPPMKGQGFSPQMSSGLRYELTELHSNIRDGNLFTAMKRAVSFLNGLLNPEARGTLGRLNRPAVMRAPSKLTMLAQTKEDSGEVDRLTEELSEFCNTGGTPEDEGGIEPAKTTGGETSHAQAQHVTMEDVQVIVGLILRLIGRFRNRKTEEEAETEQ